MSRDAKRETQDSIRHTLRSKSKVWSTLSQKVKSPNLSIKWPLIFAIIFLGVVAFQKYKTLGVERNELFFKKI